MKRAIGQFAFVAALTLAVHFPLRGQATTGSKSAVAMQKTITSGSVVASNLPLSRVVLQLADQSGVPILAKGGAGEMSVTVIAPKPRPLDGLLDEIAGSNPDLVLKKTDEGYEFWQKDDYLAEARQVKVYSLQAAQADKLQAVIEMVLTPHIGKVVRDDRLNQLIVSDVPEKQAEVADLVKQLDQKQIIRVFTLRYAEPQVLVNQLLEFVEISRQQVSGDNRTGQVIVRGTASDISMAEQMINAFDIPVPSGEDSAAR